MQLSPLPPGRYGRLAETYREQEIASRDLLGHTHLRGDVRQVGMLVEQLLEVLDVEVDDELQPATAD